MMNRETKIFVVDTEDGEQWYFLGEYIARYQDMVMDDEPPEDYTIRAWTAGDILDNNSQWKDEDEDFYHNPLVLWNWIRKEIKWQQEHGIVGIESAQEVLENCVANYKQLCIKYPSIRAGKR